MAGVAPWLQAIVALAAAGAVSAAAYRARALTFDGAVAATGVGALVFWAGGMRWAALLLLFFVSGSALTRRRHRRRGDPDETSGRDARQVLANGAVPALAAAGALVQRLTAGPGAGVYGSPPGWPWEAVLAGSLAAMTADTWATEVGLLSGARPVLLVGWRPAEPGQSGAVSGPGTLAGFAGAVFIALASWAWGAGPAAAAGAAAGGVAGLLADSLMGAALQGRWRCGGCGRAVEVPARHRRRCPGPLLYQGGRRWLDNDAVNLLASAAGALVSALATPRPGT